MYKSAALFIMLIFSMTLASPALCQKEQAKALFDKGVTALERKNFKNALSAFEEAYEISPHWAVLAHIGTCYANLNNPIKAIKALTKYLEDGGNNIPRAERETAKEIVQFQKRKIGVLLLSVDKKGVEALVDGESVGKSPFKEQFLNPGTHEVAVVFGRGDVIRRNFSIESGQEYLLRIEQEQHASPPPPPTVRTVKEIPVVEQQQQEKTISDPGFSAPPGNSDAMVKKGSLLPFWITLGFMGAGVATGGVGWGMFGHYKISATKFSDYLNTARQMNPEFKTFTWEETCHDEEGKKELNLSKSEQNYCNNKYNLENFKKSADKWMIVGIAGSGAAVIAGTLAIIFYANQDWFGESDNQVAFQISPIVGNHTNGLSFHLQF